jgi:hypothetical protein
MYCTYMVRCNNGSTPAWRCCGYAFTYQKMYRQGSSCRLHSRPCSESHYASLYLKSDQMIHVPILFFTFHVSHFSSRSPLFLSSASSDRNLHRARIKILLTMTILAVTSTKGQNSHLDIPCPASTLSKRRRRLHCTATTASSTLQDWNRTTLKSSSRYSTGFETPQGTLLLGEYCHRRLLHSPQLPIPPRGTPQLSKHRLKHSKVLLPRHSGLQRTPHLQHARVSPKPQ